MAEPVFEELRIVTLHVEALEPAVAFYGDVLGFAVEEGPAGGEDFAYLRLGALRLGLHVPYEGEGGREPGGATGLIFAVDDAGAAAESIRARGGEIGEEPTERPYGAIVGSVVDPSGNEILFSQPP